MSQRAARGGSAGASEFERLDSMVAECLLAAFYRLGAGGLAVDGARADALCQRAYGHGLKLEDAGAMPRDAASSSSGCGGGGSSPRVASEGEPIACALDWYLVGSRGGHALCMWAASCLLERGPQADAEANLKWLRRSAEGGCMEAQTTLGVRCIKDSDFENAVHWYKRAGEKGDLNSLHNLGLLYAMGQGVAEDADMARSLWVQGIAGGSGKCAQRLGELCLKKGETLEAAAAANGGGGEEGGGGSGGGSGGGGRGSCKGGAAALPGVEEGAAGAGTGACAAAALPLFEEACKWFKVAAERGEAEGHYFLFMAYKGGKGLPLDEKCALAHILAAAGSPDGEGGCADAPGGAATTASSAAAAAEGDEDVDLVRVRACYVLGEIYENGDLGCEVDLERAVDWWTRAAECSHACSMVRIGVLQRRCGEVQQAEKWFHLAASLGHAIPGEGEGHSH